MSIQEKENLARKNSHYVKREIPEEKQGCYIQLDRNENNLGFSNKVPAALAVHSQNLAVYPDVFATSLRNLLAQYHKIPSEKILIGNGSFELISLIAQIYLSPEDEAIAPKPTFEWYKTSTLLSNGKMVEVPLTAHQISLSAIAKNVTKKTKIIWICNPNNPTGTLLSENQLRHFLENLPKEILVVLDEAYIDFIQNGTTIDSVQPQKDYANVILLRTFSKVYGLAGLRIGYAIASEKIIQEISQYKIPPNTNRLGVVAAAASLNDQLFYEKVLGNAKKQFAFLYKEFEELEFEYIPSNANFVMVNLKADSEKIVEEFRKKNILVRGGTEYGYPTWIRVTVGTDDEMHAFIEALKEIVTEA